ncbi:MAG: hypothetical protein ACJ74W_16910 [Pyrinomonadaceae bacterium]
MTTKKSTRTKQGGKVSRRRAPQPAAAPTPTTTTDEERIAELTGRILRGLDGERFKAFVEVITDLGAGRASIGEVLDVCEVAARVIDGRRVARALPAIDYEPLVLAREAEIAASTSVADCAPEYRTEEHKAVLVAQRLSGWRERITAWRALGEFYAAALESDETTVDAHNELNDELDGLASDAGLHITHPDVLRLLYPLLRLRVHDIERARREVKTDVPE